MKELFKPLLLAGCMLCNLPLSAQTTGKATFLSGVAIPDDRGKTVEVWRDMDLSLIGSSHNLFIKTGPDGRFSKTIYLDTPACYFMGYNTVYLMPGDKMDGIFDNDGNKTVYTGTHAAINDYLKGTVGSHSGSYIEHIGQDNLQDLAGASRQIDSLSAARRRALKALEAPAAFKDLEEARIKADIVNTYLSIPFYRGMEEHEKDSFLLANKDRLTPLVTAICQDRYMNVETVRSVIADCAGIPFLKTAIRWTPRMEALFTAANLAGYIGNQPDMNALAEADKFLKTCKEADIRKELQAVRDKVGNLVKGAPAPDLKLTAPDGKPTTLSSHKGKNIYVDLWATWCGPCMKESPVFHNLAEKYADSPNLVFLSISIDANTKAWKQFLARKASKLPEYNCVDNKGQAAWNVTGIPRFILIGKDFTIINANAPAPSETDKIIPELDKLK